MTREKEDKIIAQAQDILERRMAVETDIKIHLQNLVHYSAYYQGARKAADALIPFVMQNFRGDEKVYIKAELDLITSSLRNTQLWLDGTQIRYRNWERDKKGKLIKCEAYFVERETITREVK